MSKLFVLLQYLLPHHGLSRLVALFARSKLLKNLLIRIFIRRYGVDLSEAVIEDPLRFNSFNDFFTRELKSHVRPLPDDDTTVISPADGAISQLGDIDGTKILQAKGHDYSLSALLGGDAALVEQFTDGCFATVYLSPRDYHRVHMPLTGRLVKMTYIPGRLFSVNQVTAASVPGLFARNERVVCLFDTAAGPMAVILVGAMIVASIETVWAGEICPAGRKHEITVQEYADSAAIELNTGAELGRFKLGSTAIVLFGNGAVDLDDSLSENSPVRMGQTIGSMKASPNSSSTTSS